MKKIISWLRYHFVVPHDNTSRIVRRLEREGLYEEAYRAMSE